MRRHGLFGLTLMVALGVAAAGLAQERFDYQVRDTMFRAFGGNEAAFQHAMSIIDEKLGEDPDHAEALVWRGAARYWQAGKAFTAGDVAGGRNLAAAAMADMDRAIALQPNTIGVLIPRAAVLLVAARTQRDPAQSRALATQASANFETALAIRQPDFSQLGQHNRGEYLSGLAESWALAGNPDKAESYLRRIVAELPNSPYAERAAAKLADWNDRRPLNCQTCH
jgi:tetratricopeptide (TPR) repeat protein